MFSESIATISGLALITILTTRHLALSKGKVFYDGDGVLEFAQNTRELIVYIKKVFRYFKKISFQYTFHFFVRVLYYIKSFFDVLYSKARKSFMNVAIKDKKTVVRFWDTLKEYKQEIDEEKTKNNKS